jgi:hypothetical protein
MWTFDRDYLGDIRSASERDARCVTKMSVRYDASSTLSRVAIAGRRAAGGAGAESRNDAIRVADSSSNKRIGTKKVRWICRPSGPRPAASPSARHVKELYHSGTMMVCVTVLDSPPASVTVSVIVRAPPCGYVIETTAPVGFGSE